MNPFDLFETTDYTFLQLGSNVHGNVILNEYAADGIVKLRDGMIQVDNMEERQSTSSVHIRPTEAFLSVLNGNLVGHGIRVQKDNHELADYRIDGQVEGYDFDTGELEFYRVTLKREDIASWEPSELPIS